MKRKVGFAAAVFSGALLLAACSGGEGDVDREAGEANSSYSFTIDASGLNTSTPYSGIGFGWDVDTCNALGNIPYEICGTVVGDASMSGTTIKLSGTASNSAASQTMSLGAPLMETSSSSLSFERVVCGNLYPISEDGALKSAGAVTCIGQGKDGVHNPWGIGGLEGGTMFGWTQVVPGSPNEGLVINFEDWPVPVAMTSRDSVALGKSAIDSSTAQNSVNLLLRQGDSDAGTTITKLEFTDDPTQYSITSFQTWGGVTSDSGSTGVTITADANRHRSFAVATWFNAATDDSSIPTDVNVSSTFPDKLNFAFCGTLTATFSDSSSEPSPPFLAGLP